jgi:5'(3')-deoxyribonucleotidase
MSLTSGHMHEPRRRPLVLVDCDGVLADFVHATIQGARQQLGAMGLTEVAKRLPDVTDRWDIKGRLVSAAPEHEESVRIAVNATWSRVGLASSLPCYPGAIEGIGVLRSVANVVAVTAPMASNATWSSEREGWLQRHMGFVGTGHDVVITGAKWLIPGDMLVEDKPETLATWKEAWPGGVGVLIDRPYNRDAEGPWTRVRCGDWHEIARLAKREHVTEETRR